MVGRVYLGLYEITSPLGQGSMGRVYLARHRSTGRHVVLKIMHEQLAGQKKFRDLFQREVELMRRFQHPYAVTLLDASLKDPQGPCLVLEYVRGSDFDRLLQHYRRFSLGRIGRLIGQLCEVLHAAHGQHIIHRDLKPANLMVADWGKPLERLKVMDFGLAKLSDESDSQTPTKLPTGPVTVSGTAEYMCPEQVRGLPMDQRGDLYSVGVILFELLTGRLPFVRATPRATCQAHVTDPVPTFAEVGLTGVPAAVEAVVQACLAKDPARRPANAWELGQRLESALGQPILDRDGSSPTVQAAGTVKPVPPATLASPLRHTVLHAPRHTQFGAKAVQPTMPAPTRSQEVLPDEDSDTVCRLDVRLPAGQVVDKVAQLLEKSGGKVVQRGADSLRALVGEPVAPGAGPRLQFGGQAVLTEVELEIDHAPASREGAVAITLTLRPVGAAAQARPAAWRTRCEQLQAAVRTLLGP